MDGCRLLILIVLGMALGGTTALAGETGPELSWQSSYDEICAGTSNAMALSVEQLSELLERCDALETEVKKLDPTRAKIYRKRLDLACNLYRFVLEEKTSRQE